MLCLRYRNYKVWTLASGPVWKEVSVALKSLKYRGQLAKRVVETCGM